TPQRGDGLVRLGERRRRPRRTPPRRLHPPAAPLALRIPQRRRASRLRGARGGALASPGPAGAPADARDGRVRRAAPSHRSAPPLRRRLRRLLRLLRDVQLPAVLPLGSAAARLAARRDVALP